MITALLKIILRLALVIIGLVLVTIVCFWLSTFASQSFSWTVFGLITMALLTGYTCVFYIGLPFFRALPKWQRLIISGLIALPCVAFCYAAVYVTVAIIEARIALP
jgi:hypothetical protein